MAIDRGRAAREVAIAGGGLAGLTCAKVLVDHGDHPRIFEGLPYLGGRASTYRDADGDWIEQGLHIFLGAYSELRVLLRDVGVDPDAVLAKTTELRLEDPDAQLEATFGNDPLRSPFKTLLRGLSQNDYLSLADKLSIIPLVAPGVLDYEQLRRRFDRMTVTEWWRRAHGSEAVLERFIRPFCRGVQFTDPDQLSAFNFLVWIHHLFRSAADLRIAGYRGARDETIFQPIGRWLVEHGAEIRCAARVTSLDLEGTERVRALVLETGERIEADAFVLAMPVWVVRRVLPAALRELPFFAELDALPIAPAISVQLFFDEPVIGTSDFTLVARSAACVYQDQHTTAYAQSGSRVSVIVSPADEWLGRDDDAIVAHVLDRIGRSHPGAREGALRKRVVLRHPEHLVRPLPGAMSRRPPQITPVANLFFAGDWTEQTFLGCQEGAVRSGIACAHEMIGRGTTGPAKRRVVPPRERDRRAHR